MKYRAIALVFFVCGLLAVATPVLADGPGDIKYGQGLTETMYLPILMKAYPGTYTGTITTTVLVPCVDTTRGALYRQLTADTATTWAWPYAWAVSACSTCESGQAYTNGYYLGSGLAHIPSIMVKVFTLVLSVVSSGVSSLLSIFGLIDAPETAYSISCASDAEYICMGIAIIVAVDEMSHGWVNVVVTLLVGVMAFYLATYVIKEIRSILDSSQSSSEGGE